MILIWGHWFLAHANTLRRNGRFGGGANDYVVEALFNFKGDIPISAFDPQIFQFGSLIFN